MGRKSSKAVAPISVEGSRIGQRGGNPGKVRLHETVAGEPAKVGQTKWRGPAGGRDPEPPSEKEPGKSRGPGG